MKLLEQYLAKRQMLAESITALQDAASVSGLLITTEAAIVEAPKKSAPAGGMPGGMGGMGDMDF